MWQSTRSSASTAVFLPLLSLPASSPNPLPASPALSFLFPFSPPPSSSSLTAALSLPSPLPSPSIFAAVDVLRRRNHCRCRCRRHPPSRRPTTSQISSSPPLSSIGATSLPSFLHRRCSAQHFLCPEPSTSSTAAAAFLSSAVAHSYRHRGVPQLPFLADRCHRPRGASPKASSSLSLSSFTLVVHAAAAVISSSPPLSITGATSLPSFLHCRCSAQHFLYAQPSTSSTAAAAAAAASLSSVVIHSYRYHRVPRLPFLADSCHRASPKASASLSLSSFPVAVHRYFYRGEDGADLLPSLSPSFHFSSPATTTKRWTDVGNSRILITHISLFKPRVPYFNGRN